MNPKHLIPLIVFIAMTIFLGIGLTLNPTKLPSTMLNKPAPEFALPILTDSQASFSPADLKGQRWILNVWASWCVSCRYEHPLLNEIAAKTDIPIVGLNYKDDAEKAQQWLSERGNPYTKIPLDIAGDVGIDWGVYGVPETFVIDEQGLVIYKHPGPITADIVQNEIWPLFKTTTLTTSTTTPPATASTADGGH